MFAGFRETGGYEKLVEGFFNAVATNRSLQVPSDPDSGLCGGVPDNAMHLIRHAQFLQNGTNSFVSRLFDQHVGCFSYTPRQRESRTTF